MSQMSQSNDVEWSKDECKVFMDKNLSKLTDGFVLLDVTERVSITKNLAACLKRILKIIPANCFESEVFSTILPKIESTVSAIGDKIAAVFEKHSENLDEIANYIKDLQVLIGCVEVCFDVDAFRVKEIDVYHVFSLPTSALNISYKVFQLYDNCRKFSQFPRVSEYFSSVFSQSTALATKFMSFWCKTNVVIGLELHLDLLLTVCYKVTNVCRIFEFISGKSPVTLWKFVINNLVKYCDSIKDRVNIAEIIQLLWSLTETRLKNLNSLCFNSEEITAKDELDQISKSIQQCNFNVKIIIKLAEKFQFFLGNCFKDLLNLILCLYQNTSPSLTAIKVPDSIKSDFERNLNVLVEPLILQLLEEPEFIHMITNSSFNDSCSYSPYSWCSMYVFILDNINKIPANLLNSILPVVFNRKGFSNSKTQSLLEKFFHVFSLCELELALPALLPGVMCDGKPFHLVSFYEHCCTRLCSFIVALPAKQFPLLENVLLSNVLGDNSWKSLMASDLWTFLGRVESAELCYEHCCCLADLRSRHFTANRLHLTLRRLFGILADEHKTLFYRKYHPSVSDEIWISIGFEALASVPSFRDDLDLLNNQLIARISEMFEPNADLTNSGDMTKNLSNVVCLLRKLAAVNSNFKQKHVKVCYRLWQCIPTNLIPLSELVEQFCYHLIEWSSQLIPVLPNVVLLEILQKVSHLLANSNSDIIRFGNLQFLNLFANKFVAASSEQSLILKQISVLMSSCLEEKNPVLLNIGLETFSNVSQSTPHETIISECLHQKPALQKMVTNFLHRRPIITSGDSNLDKKMLLNQMKSVSEPSNETAPFSPMEVEPKELPDEVERVLQHLEDNIKELDGIYIPPNVDQTLLTTKIHQLAQKLLDFHERKLTLMT